MSTPFVILLGSNEAVPYIEALRADKPVLHPTAAQPVKVYVKRVVRALSTSEDTFFTVELVPAADVTQAVAEVRAEALAKDTEYGLFAPGEEQAFVETAKLLNLPELDVSAEAQARRKKCLDDLAAKYLKPGMTTPTFLGDRTMPGLKPTLDPEWQDPYQGFDLKVKGFGFPLNVSAFKLNVADKVVAFESALVEGFIQNQFDLSGVTELVITRAVPGYGKFLQDRYHPMEFITGKLDPKDFTDDVPFAKLVIDQDFTTKCGNKGLFIESIGGFAGKAIVAMTFGAKLKAIEFLPQPADLYAAA